MVDVGVQEIGTALDVILRKGVIDIRRDRDKLESVHRKPGPGNRLRVSSRPWRKYDMADNRSECGDDNSVAHD